MDEYMGPSEPYAQAYARQSKTNYAQLAIGVTFLISALSTGIGLGYFRLPSWVDPSRNGEYPPKQ